MKLNDLILVKCFPKIEYFKIIDAKEAEDKGIDLEIDLKRETWSFQDFNNYPIGILAERFPYDPDKNYGELIGVYNKENLDKMVSDIEEEMKKD